MSPSICCDIFAATGVGHRGGCNGKPRLSARGRLEAELTVVKEQLAAKVTELALVRSSKTLLDAEVNVLRQVNDDCAIKLGLQDALIAKAQDVLRGLKESDPVFDGECALCGSLVENRHKRDITEHSNDCPWRVAFTLIS